MRNQWFAGCVLTFLLQFTFSCVDANRNSDGTSGLTQESTSFTASSSTLHDDAELFVVDNDASSEEALNIWPFHKKNKTHEDDSCHSHSSCNECYQASSFCHWCSHDNACHSRGSFRGCFSGESCSQPEKENSTCASHKTCGECSLSSSFCHFCAHDGACHSVGSYYGCATGVDCYSNDRCQRYKPEDVDGVFIDDVGIGPLLIIFAMGLFCCCCSSLCFCFAKGAKGAYDDIVIVASHADGRAGEGSQSTIATRNTYVRVPNSIDTPAIPETEEADVDEEVAPVSAAAEEDENGPNSGDNHLRSTEFTEEAALLESHLGDNDVRDNYSLMTDFFTAQPSAYETVQARGGSNSMQRVFNVVRICYALSIVAIVCFVAGAVRYFPKKPQYNVCNDNVAWKSLVDSMTSMKAEASFEILVSVLNPNHLDVVVETGRGSFKHNGAFVGTFVIPPTSLKAMSLMDIRVIATFSPSKWEALSLTAEYYKGTLEFDLDARGTIRIPALLDFTHSGGVNDIHVKVDDPKLKDRHLCACPTWDDAKNKTPDFLLL